MPNVNSLETGDIFYLEEESFVTGAMARKYYKFLSLDGNIVKVEPSSIISEAFFKDLPPDTLDLEDISNFILVEDKDEDHENWNIQSYLLRGFIPRFF